MENRLTDEQQPTKQPPTEHSTTSVESSKQRAAAIIQRVKSTAEAMGCQLSRDAFKLFAFDLFPYPDAQIDTALVRCRREIRGRDGFPPQLTIGDVLDRIGAVSEGAIAEAEARAAWDLVTRYVDKFVVVNAEGVYEERAADRIEVVDQNTRVLRQEPPPVLEQRIIDTVRRVGGWRALKNISDEDYPHIQRRFYDEFRAWRATDAVIARSLLDGNEAFRQLCEAKQMPGPQLTGSRVQAKRLMEGK